MCAFGVVAGCHAGCVAALRFRRLYDDSVTLLPAEEGLFAALVSQWTAQAAAQQSFVSSLRLTPGGDVVVACMPRGHQPALGAGDDGATQSDAHGGRSGTGVGRVARFPMARSDATADSVVTSLAGDVLPPAPCSLLPACERVCAQRSVGESDKVVKRKYVKLVNLFK